MPATDVVCDASVVLKWFHAEGESEVADARAILSAHRAGGIVAFILDLTFYELGNVLVRPLARGAEQTAAVLDAVEEICPAIPSTGADRRLACELAERHGLTLYDAIYASVARRRNSALVTADRELLRAGVGETAGALAARLSLAGRA